MATETPKVARDGTMEVTAKEGLAYLEKEKPDLAEKLKQQLKEDEANKTENGSGDAPDAENANGVAKVTRDNTMVQTAQEGKEFLEKDGGVKDTKTRAQEKELNDSKTEEKEATKRCADETTDESEEAKKQKVEKNGAEKKEEADESEEAKKQKVEKNGAEKKEEAEEEKKE